MNKIILIFSILLTIVGCKKESDFDFEETVNAKSISFKAIHGGAIMTYNIPKSETIYGINVIYDSPTGKRMTVGGTYGSNEIVIKGFVNGHAEIAAKISYVSRDNRVSKPIHMTFSTLPAGAVSIFENMKVEPYWDGFSVTFDAPDNIDGLINIGYMGISPTTGKPSIILKETRTIASGENKLLYNNIQDKEEIIKIVIWTEDLFQNEAKRASYDVMPKMTKRVDPSILVFDGNSYENTNYKFSAKYLFDGDTKGINNFQKKDGAYIFATRSDVILKPQGIIDLQEPRVLAFFRIYTSLNTNVRASGSVGIADGAAPNQFKLYGSNDKGATADEWVELAEYNQSKTQDEVFWWCFPQFDPSKEYKSIEDLEAADPCFIDVNFEVSKTKYRYLKVEFLDMFKQKITAKRVQCSEMEVFVEK